MRKIAVGDLGEFWYGDYKEPFEQLEGGVPGHPVGVVLKADDGKLLCAWCGGTFEHLGQHVRATHKTSSREYKETVGLLQKAALVSERIRQERIATGLRGRERMRQLGLERQRKLRELGSDPFDGNRNTKGREVMQTPELANKTGRCYSQTLQVAKMLARQGKLTERQMSQHGIGPGTIKRWFGGGMQELRRAVGVPVMRNNRYGDAELTTILRNLAQSLGRTPSLSDLDRFGGPTYQTYRARFGSWNDACRAAGLDPRLPERGLSFDIDVLTTYATTGRQNETASLLQTDSTLVRRILAKYGYPFEFFYHGPGRREWAADMARRLAGVPEQAVA